jgi:GDP-L-fucose synthase
VGRRFSASGFSVYAARALILLADTYEGVVNLASGSLVSIRELAEKLRSVIDPTLCIEWDTSMPSGQLFRAYDVSVLRRLGFRPSTELETGLAVTVKWYKENAGCIRR